LLKQGREFLDPTSETSMRYKQALTEGAMRSIDAGARGAHRAARDFGLQAGVARRPFHATQVAAATEAQFSAQRAQVANQAALQFETFSREFAQNSVEFAQAWINGESYVRDQFSTALSSVYESLAAVEMDFLKTSVGLSLESEKQEAQVKQWKWDRISENILRANEAGAGMLGTIIGMGGGGG
jgi:hypothetical protein